MDETIKLTRSKLTGPHNIGSDKNITINGLVDLIADIAGKTINKVHIDGPLGVRGRNSDNKLIKKELDWEPTQQLKVGIAKTYEWIDNNIRNNLIDVK